MSERIVQTLLDSGSSVLLLPWAACSSAWPPSGEELSLTPSCPSPDTAPCRSLGPCRCHTEQSSALPLRSLWGAAAAMRPPLSSSALGWANPGTSAAPHVFPSIPFTISAALLQTLSNSPFSAVVPQTAHSTQGAAAPAQCRVGQSHPLTSWQCHPWCIPGYSWPSWLPGHY